MYCYTPRDGQEAELKEALAKANMYGRRGQKPFVIRNKYNMERSKGIRRGDSQSTLYIQSTEEHTFDENQLEVDMGEKSSEFLCNI